MTKKKTKTKKTFSREIQKFSPNLLLLHNQKHGGNSTTASTTRNTRCQDRTDTDLPEGKKRRGSVLARLCSLTTAFAVSFYFAWHRSCSTSLLVSFTRDFSLFSPSLTSTASSSLRKTPISHPLRQTDTASVGQLFLCPAASTIPSTSKHQGSCRLLLIS